MKHSERKALAERVLARHRETRSETPVQRSAERVFQRPISGTGPMKHDPPCVWHFQLDGGDSATVITRYSLEEDVQRSLEDRFGRTVISLERQR